MEKVPSDVCLKILSLLDHQDLVSALQGSGSSWLQRMIFAKMGIDRATFYAPTDSKSWKDVYAVQDRCDHVGLGLKIIREGDDYFLIHQGEIQRHLGSRTLQLGTDDVSTSASAGYTGDEIMSRNERQMGILDRILFFIGDLETAKAPAKLGRLL